MVSVGQLGAKLQAFKVGGCSCCPEVEPGPSACGSIGGGRQRFFQTYNFDSL